MHIDDSSIRDTSDIPETQQEQVQIISSNNLPHKYNTENNWLNQ